MATATTRRLKISYKKNADPTVRVGVAGDVGWGSCGQNAIRAGPGTCAVSFLLLFSGVSGSAPRQRQVHVLHGTRAGETEGGRRRGEVRADCPSTRRRGNGRRGLGLGKPRAVSLVNPVVAFGACMRACPRIGCGWPSARPLAHGWTTHSLPARPRARGEASCRVVVLVKL